VDELLRFVEKLNTAAGAVLDLLKRKSDDASLSELPFSVSVPNFVQIRAIATEL